MNPNSTGGGTEIPKKKQIPSSDGDEDEFGVLSPIEKNELIQSERFQNLLLSSATLHQHFANNYSSNSNSSSNSAAANAGKNNSKQGKISNFSAEEDDETGTDNTTSLVIKSNRGMPSEEFYSTDPTDSSDGEGDDDENFISQEKFRKKILPKGGGNADGTVEVSSKNSSDKEPLLLENSEESPLHANAYSHNSSSNNNKNYIATTAGSSSSSSGGGSGSGDDDSASIKSKKKGAKQISLVDQEFGDFKAYMKEVSLFHKSSSDGNLRLTCLQ